jgi:hypothetical protein
MDGKQLLIPTIFVGLITVVLLVILHAKGGNSGAAAYEGLTSLAKVLPVLAFALVAASCLVYLVPPEFVAKWLGEEAHQIADVARLHRHIIVHASGIEQSGDVPQPALEHQIELVALGHLGVHQVACRIRALLTLREHLLEQGIVTRIEQPALPQGLDSYAHSMPSFVIIARTPGPEPASVL